MAAGSTEFLDLNDDCLIAILERLPWQHMGAVASTCSRMQSLALYVAECNVRRFGQFQMSVMQKEFGECAKAATVRHFRHFGHCITTIDMYDHPNRPEITGTMLHEMLLACRFSLRSLQIKDMCLSAPNDHCPLFPNLSELKLDGCSFASNYSLATFLRNLPRADQLTTLSIGKRIDVDSAAIRELSKCRNLKVLNFTALDELAGNCMALHRLEQLEELNVTCVRFIQQIPNLLAFLGSTQTLRKLSLDRCRLSDQLVVAICRFSHIERLEFGFVSNLFGSQYTALNNLGNVKVFVLRRWGDMFSDVLLRLIRKMVQLEEFRLEALDKKLNAALYLELAQIFRERHKRLKFRCCYRRVVGDGEVTPDIVAANADFVEMLDI